MPPDNARRRPRQETASKTSRGTTVNPDDTANAVDQAIAAACAIRGCGCGCGPDVTVTRDGGIRRVTVAHDDWCAAIGGDAA